MRVQLPLLRILPLFVAMALFASPGFEFPQTPSRDATNPPRAASKPSSPPTISAAPGDGIFGPSYGVSTGQQEAPFSLAVGHFNADSNPDIAAVISGAAGVSVLLGNGNGTFTLAGAFPVAGGFPTTLAISDFNADGKSDLAVANGAPSVSVLLGNGNGTFGPHAEFPVGLWPENVAIGDFDGDGAKDLASSNGGSNDVSVLLGNGDGTFGPQTTFPVGEFPRGIVVGDFNEDGDDDLAVANRTSTEISLLFGNGDGTFQPQATLRVGIGRPNPLVLRDFSGDGHADLAVGADSSRGVNIFLGLGDGNFQTLYGVRTSQNGTPVALAIGDFNGDGAPDLVSAEWFTNAVALLLGVGNGIFAPSNVLTTGLEPIAVAAGDFNADGWEDLAVSTQDSELIGIFLNQHPFPGVCNDADSDGFGVPGDPSCPAGAVDDCNDAVAGISPGAVEICDGIDNNCDVLDGFDSDFDTYTTCGGDCDDTRSSVRPGAKEYCNGRDDDCNGSVDVPAEEARDMEFGSDTVTLSWSASTGVGVSYDVYRGGFVSGAPFSYNPTCFQASVPQPSVGDGQLPPAGSGFSYIVTGRNSCGQGTMGFSSAGDPRPNNLPCP